MGERLKTVHRLGKCPFCGGHVSMYEMGDDGWRWYFIASGKKDNSNGLYDLRIAAPGGAVLLEVHNIRLERCLELMKSMFEGARR